MTISRASLYVVPPVLLVLALTGLPLLRGQGAQAPAAAFQLEEATIATMHRAIQQGQIAPPKALNIRTIQTLAEERQFRFHVAQYLSRRSADWAKRGFTETLVDWPTLNARSKFWSDEQRATWKNWEEVDTMRSPLGERQGVAERLMLRELLRRVEMKVIQENRLDVVVRLHTSLPPGKIGLAPQPGPAGDTRGDLRMGPYAGETEVLIPAGY